MNEVTAAALRTRLERDADTDVRSLETATDKTLAIGRDVWRLRWRGQLATAVAEDAKIHTTCGALLDVLTLLEVGATDGDVDRSAVNVLVDRPPPNEHPSETDQALRSLRDAVQDVEARLWYRGTDQAWTQDRAPAPSCFDDELLAKRWLDDLLMPRLNTKPGPLARALVKAVRDPSLHLYPSEIRARCLDVWALRIDGLEIGTVSTATGTLTVGKPGKAGDGPQRRMFSKVFGQASVSVALEPNQGQLGIPEASARIRELLRRFRDVDVVGAPISHRTIGGVRVVDEHTLEARLLKGLTHLDPHGDLGLVKGDREVARGSQFPTLWGKGGRARYLDALLTSGRTPLAVELKVASGGQGRYYRRSLIQAVLYRHFIRSAPGLEPWFEEAGLDRMATEAAIGLPMPRRWGPAFHNNLKLLRRVAKRVGVSVYVIDDRATPDWEKRQKLAEPAPDQRELLSWRLAAALSNSWPKSLGRTLELHGGGGQYDELQLQSIGDDAWATLATPSVLPRVSLNRCGSVWVRSQTGSDRWIWRGVWSHLAAGGDILEAARTIGSIAGLRAPESGRRPTFPDIALKFLETVAEPQEWSWRCAWPNTGDVAEWVAAVKTPLRAYPHQPSKESSLPTIADIWAAVHHDWPAILVDQVTLQVWVTTRKQFLELGDPDPMGRITAAVALVS